VNDPFRIGEDRFSGVVALLVAVLFGLTLIRSALLFNGVNHADPGPAATGLRAAAHAIVRRLGELCAVAGGAAGLLWAAYAGRAPYGSSRAGYAGGAR